MYPLLFIINASGHEKQNAYVQRTPHTKTSANPTEPDENKHVVIKPVFSEQSNMCTLLILPGDQPRQKIWKQNLREVLLVVIRSISDLFPCSTANYANSNWTNF